MDAPDECRRSRLRASLLAMGLCAAANAAHAQVFATVDEHGQLQVAPSALPGYARFDPHAQKAATPRQPSSQRSSIGTPRAEAAAARMIEQVAGEFSLEPRLLHALVQVESNFNPRAVSRAGAAGLTQLMPATARRFGVEDRFHPLHNLRGGAAYLSWLLKRFDGQVPLALAAYNAGEGAVQKYGNQIPPYPETRAYVRKVISSAGTHPQHLTDSL